MVLIVVGGEWILHFVFCNFPAQWWHWRSKWRQNWPSTIHPGNRVFLGVRKRLWALYTQICHIPIETIGPMLSTLTGGSSPRSGLTYLTLFNRGWGQQQDWSKVWAGLGQCSCLVPCTLEGSPHHTPIVRQTGSASSFSFGPPNPKAS